MERTLSDQLPTNGPRLWAKWDQGTGSIHPLQFHLLDVGHVAQALLSSPAGRPASSMLAKAWALDEQQAIAWASFLAAAHDVGKAEWCFQKRCPATQNHLESLGLALADCSSRAIPHATVSALTMTKFLGRSTSLPSPLHQRTADRFAGVLNGHHGAFSDWRSFRARLEVQENGTQWPSLREEFAGSLARHFLGTVAGVPTLDPDDNTTPVLLAGTIVFADWLASDSNGFPFADAVSLDEYCPVSVGRAQRAVEHIGWSKWRAAASPSSLSSLFSHVAGDGTFSPNALQRRIEEIAITASPRCVIIEAPTGIGKTEAALTLEHHWACGSGNRGTYFALPTTATSNQMFERIQDYLRAQSGTGPADLQLIHGRSLLNNVFQRLRAGHMAQGEQDADRHSLTANAWFARPKRGFLGLHAVGTVDQALLSVLQTRHGFLRLFGLAGKTVVFDEVHAYDIHMQTLFEHTLLWLRALGCTVIILTATLPRVAAQRLLEAFGGSLGSGTLADYPRLSWVDSTGASHSEHLSDSPARSVSLRWQADDGDALAEEVIRLAETGGCVAWICNTVARAQACYAGLGSKFADAGFEVDIFHARYPHALREERERRVLRRFGKLAGDDRPRKSILFATQVIEQSLDLDFDLMISELAPADLLLQRAGRLHRHSRPRPSSLCKPELWILSPSLTEGCPDLRDKPYSPWIRYRTWLVLKELDALSLPGDTARIIEYVYGDASSEENATKVKQWWKDEESARRTARYDAQTMLIPPPFHDDNADILDSWNRELAEDDDPSTASTLQACTRLQEAPSIQLICLHEREGRLYTLTEGGVEISWEAAPSATDIRVLLEQTLSLTDWWGLRVDPALRLPKAWDRVPALRFHVCARFRSGSLPAGRRKLVWDDQLGLRIEN